MAISINQQPSSLSYIERLAQQHEEQQAKLASAKRINSAADDAAGLQIANRLTSEVNAQAQASVNAQDNVNIQVTQASKLSAITDSLQRANELSIQSANPLTDNTAIQNEFSQLTEQINTIASDALGQDNFIAALDANDPAATQAAIESAFGSIENAASAIGANINTLTSQSNTFEVSRVNTSAARSRIEDTDFAKISSEREQDNLLLRSAILNKKDQEERKGLLINKLI
jgi:flagellin